jgi:hypothetical protein
MMDEKIDYGSISMPNLAGINSMFPYIKDYKRGNLYVLYPTVNPMACSFDLNFPNLENSSTEEEIFPDFRCKSCSVSVPTYSEYVDHLASHNKNVDISNPNSPSDKTTQKIDQDRKNESILNPLIKTTNSLRFFCFRCPESFECDSELEKHMESHSDTKKAFCVICKSTFAGISSLRKHILMFHCQSRDRKPCPYCNYRCFQTSDLEKHIARRHTRDFKYKCSHCVKGFATPKELRNHERRRHLDIIEVSPEACPP